MLRFKQLADRVFLQLGADDTKSARDLRAAGSDIRFARYIVEVDPLSVLALYDAFCSEHEAVSVRIFQCFQGFFDLFDRIFFRRFDADAVKDLVRVMMPLMSMVVPAAAVIIMVVVVMFVFMLMVVMMLVTAATFLVIIVLMMMVMVMVMVMIMIMLVTAAACLIIIVMVVVVIVTTAACVIVIVMVRVRLFFFQMVQRFVNRIALFHCSQDLLAVQRVPICRDDRRVRIVFPQQSNDLREFVLVHAFGMAENDGRRVFHLVIKELSEILHIDFSFLRIDDGCKTVQLHIRKI